MDTSHAIEDYLSPRTKVARMLADIDDAPTPSPPLHNAHAASLMSSQQGSPTANRIAKRSQNSSGTQPSPENSSDDEDASPTRPLGRAARRMYERKPTVEEDLYAATPDVSRTLSLHSTRLSSPHQQSQGLFVSPTKSDEYGGDDELPAMPAHGPSRLAELVAAKRAERLAREAANRANSPSQETELPQDIVKDVQKAPADPELERILSDAVRPTRKASKKAMLEMERETQRLAREQALAHHMKTKKKFSTTDLFARFNFRQAQGQIMHDASSSAPNSDSFEPVHREPLSTPPSSPPTPWDRQKAIVERGALARMQIAREDSLASISELPIDDIELPAVEDIIKQSQAAKAVGTLARQDSPSRSARGRRRFELLPLDDDNDDLDIIQPMPTHLKTFDRIKPISSKGEAHSKAIHVLKHLAHLTTDDTKTRGRKTATVIVPPSIVNYQLLATARAHAQQAQQERLAELKAKGIVIMSAEEQEREADQIDNLLEKARQEAVEIRKKEKAAAKQTAEGVLASDDEDEDADWQDSEDEADSDVVELIEDAADETSSEMDDMVEHEPEDVLERSQAGLDGDLQYADEDDTTAQRVVQRKPRVILDDDDDEADVELPPMPAAPSSTAADDTFAAFGFKTTQMLMSPTAAFAATMQTPTQMTQGADDSSRWSAVRRPSASIESQSQLVPASQAHDKTQKLDLDWVTQLPLPETPLGGKKPASIVTIETPGWEPSQDAGLPSPWTAARRGIIPQSSNTQHETQSTVRLRISESPEHESPKHKGRLMRRSRQVYSSDEEQDEAVVKKSKSKDAFAEMQKRRLASMNATDRAAAEKEMKNMMDDQAEESEDEYAGLGGDDSNMIAPETEEDRAMIDESNIELDEKEERDMQRFYAERQRAAEEEATSKLYKDLTTGALRRRQGVGWELDEDEDDIAARRRQIKLREEARKRRLLLQDDNVKGLLEGRGDSKGREAFLKTIGDDDDLDIPLEFEEEPVEVPESTQTPLQETNNNKRPLESTQDDKPMKRARRVQEVVLTRPTSMLQVKESLSFLLDEPEVISFGPSALDLEIEQGPDENDVDAEMEEHARDNDGGYAPDNMTRSSQEMPPPPLPTDRLPAAQRRTPATNAVIDRLSLKRNSSSSGSTGSTRSAWSTGASKAPSLLRRATSNLSVNNNTNERGVSYSNGANARGVSLNNTTAGSKKSSLSYQSRAQERRLVNERLEKKKQDDRKRIAEFRRQSGGAFGSAGFVSGQWE